MSHSTLHLLLGKQMSRLGIFPASLVVKGDTNKIFSFIAMSSSSLIIPFSLSQASTLTILSQASNFWAVTISLCFDFTYLVS